MATKQITRHKKIPAKPVEAILQNADFAQINVKEIDFSPLNYRKYFSEDALNEFAAELKQHGIISPLTVRPLSKNKYELVAGERRLRAAIIAGLQTVPAAIVSLTDEQVTEIQLAENLQRENPHPMDEAHAVQRMLDSGIKLEEIALRLGKSRQFVFVRLKLMKLAEPFREIFYHNKMTLQQALDIALLSAEAQQDFFEEECSEWQDENFDMDDKSWSLRQYKYDLKNPPFDIKDKKLLPEVGACTGCPFNTATLKSLFPDYAKEAVCTNSSCYKNKCTATRSRNLLKAFEETQPVALITSSHMVEELANFSKQIPQMEALPIHEHTQVTVLHKPTEPDADDYKSDEDEEEVFDSESFEEVKQEYETELAAYELQLASGKAEKALYILRDTIAPVLFIMGAPAQRSTAHSGQRISMKNIQEAIKQKTATAAMIQDAIAGMQEREERAQEIDREKIQLELHRQLQERTTNPDAVESLTESDQAAAVWLIYNALDYNTRRTVYEVLIEKLPQLSSSDAENLYLQLKGLTEQQYSYLIRMALLGKADSKNPGHHAGYHLYQVAVQANVPVQQITEQQQEKTKQRQDKLKERVKEWEKKAKRLQKSE